MTSSDRNPVVEWARAHLRESIDADATVEAFTVPSLFLARLLEAHGWQSPVDILRVDAEGFANTGKTRTHDPSSSAPTR